MLGQFLGRLHECVPSSRLNPSSPATFPWTSMIRCALWSSFSRRVFSRSNLRHLLLQRIPFALTASFLGQRFQGPATKRATSAGREIELELRVRIVRRAVAAVLRDREQVSHGAARLFPEPLSRGSQQVSPSISAPRARPTSRSERASSRPSVTWIAWTDSPNAVQRPLPRPSEVGCSPPPEACPPRCPKRTNGFPCERAIWTPCRR